jgi:hypothetical protein
MMGKSTKFFSRLAKQMQIICKPYFFRFSREPPSYAPPCLITLQNYESMKALYDFINSVIVIVNVIVTSSLPSSSV